MKTWMKTAMAAALAASVGLGATAVMAGGPFCDGAGARGERMAMRDGGPGMFSERAELRLNRLEQDLKLKPAQTAAWSELKTTLLDKAAQAEERFRAFREEGRPQTALERMQRMEEAGRDGIEQMAAVRAAVATFYGGLDDTQKKIFDDEFRMMPMGPGGSRHHRGRG